MKLEMLMSSAYKTLVRIADTDGVTLALRVVQYRDSYNIAAIIDRKFVRDVIADKDVTLTILLTGTTQECQSALQGYIMSLGYTPILNRREYISKRVGNSCPIHCSNGVTYETQSAAAKALGLDQAHISNCVTGKRAHINGLYFTRA